MISEYTGRSVEMNLSLPNVREFMLQFLLTLVYYVLL